ncbi:MAG TPA: EF-hand domain-containing protein [Methylophilaceae bacterium]|nr:EF-hand domain-containing protein [Methylophilaceae bacterium]HQR61097.1 EF-hand domain-containing protein [Methylophilaceae bacterium]
MNKLTSLLLASTLAFALPALADHDGMGEHCDMHKKQHSPLAEADTNKDGSIDKAEAQAMHDKHFDKMDANHDGKLSKEEVAACKNDGMHDKGSMGFKKADKDNDGTLDKKEAKSLPNVSKHFDEIDVDKDGTVSRDEVHNFMKDQHPH